MQISSLVAGDSVMIGYEGGILGTHKQEWAEVHYFVESIIILPYMDSETPRQTRL